jgi:hypothetical protein
VFTNVCKCIALPDWVFIQREDKECLTTAHQILVCLSVMFSHRREFVVEVQRNNEWIDNS